MILLSLIYFFIGLVTGKGNDKSTPDILINDIFKCGNQAPIPQQYFSVELGERRVNEALVYCGFYDIDDRKIPYVLVIKVGTSEEKKLAKPGNRGKRGFSHILNLKANNVMYIDSQLIIYKFFHQVIFGESKFQEWEPLQRDIAQKMVSLIGKDPNSYEHLLVADADTFIYPQGIRELVSFLEHSPRYFGVCGTLYDHHKL